MDKVHETFDSGYTSRETCHYLLVDYENLHSASWVQLRSYVEEKSSDSSLENREHGRRESVTLTTWHPLIRKSWH
jgi:hypothetical protein